MIGNNLNMCGKVILLLGIVLITVSAGAPSATDTAAPMPKQHFSGLEVTIGDPQDEVLDKLRTIFTVHLGEPDWDHPEREREFYSLIEQQTIIGSVLFEKKKLIRATRDIFDSRQDTDLGNFFTVLTNELDAMKQSSGCIPPEVHSDTGFFQEAKTGNRVLSFRSNGIVIRACYYDSPHGSKSTTISHTAYAPNTDSCP